MSKPISHLHLNHATHVAIARADITAFIENDVPLPIMFQSRCLLEKCMNENSMIEVKLKGIKREEALLFKGNYNGNSALPLEALWVQAKSNKYRKAFHAKHKLANIEVATSSLHADHIVNRAILKHLYKNHDPWVMVFETPASANSGVGASIERNLSAIAAEVEQIFLDPLHAFKLFATDMPKTKDEFDAVMKSIDGQIQNKKFVEKMKCEIEKLYKPT
jgi:hypothetical protein